MSRNPALEMLRNPRPYPQGANGATPPRAKQPNRALDELRKPQPYPTASQPTQRPPAQNPQPGRYGPPNASQPAPKPQNNPLGNLRNPKPYPSASQPQVRRPTTPQSTGRPTAPQTQRQPASQPPSASQPRPSPTSAQGKPTGAPQKRKPRVAVSSGAPKPYHPPRQTTQHVTPPVRTMPPSASQPQPQRYQPNPGLNQTPTPQGYTPRTTTPRSTTPVSPYSTTPRATTPRSVTPQGTTPRTTTPATTPRSTTPIQDPPILTTNPPTPQHAVIQPTQYQPSYAASPGPAEPLPTYKNPPPMMESNSMLIPNSGYDESDVPAEYDRDSKRSFGRDLPSPESDIESGPASERTPSPFPEKKIYHDEEVDTLPNRVSKTTSKSRLADEPDSDRRAIYGLASCSGRCKLILIVAIVFMIILAIALALGLGLSNRGVDFSGSFAITLGEECNMAPECNNFAENGYPRRGVLMIALDGFRPEFLDESWSDTIPNIHRLAECGSVSTKMEPSYPSTTYPNLYTLVTGLFPTVHGIFADFMERDGMVGAFDPRSNPQSIALQDPGWYNGKSIWQLGREQGVITGSHSWIGNTQQDHSIDGFNVDPKPHYHVQHDPEIDFHARIQSALNWFTQDFNKAEFVTVYMEEPGRTIMQHGVSSDRVITALQEVDDAIGLFMENLVHDDVTDCFDIVIASTNGQLDVSCENTTYFDTILPNTLFYDTTTHGMNSMGFITPTDQSPTDCDTADELVKKIGCSDRPFNTYTLDTVPPKYHFYNEERYEAAVVVMDDWQTFASNERTFDNEMCTGARGGYSPTNPEMKGVLIGFGPSFKKNFTKMDGFSNVEVHNLMAELAGIEPESNNGTQGTLHDLLVSPAKLLSELDDHLTAFDSDEAKCVYPTDETERNTRKNDANTGCQCILEGTPDIDSKDNLLNIPTGQADVLVREQLTVFGAPLLVDVEGAIGRHNCRLVQNNYMTIFENKLSVPLYVAFRVTRGQATSTNLLEDCFRYDVRLEPEISPKCSSYNSAIRKSLPDGVTMGKLLQQSLADDENEQFNILITSNMVPMWEDFEIEVWKPIAGQLRQLVGNGMEIHVVAGPAFDNNRDGIRDTYREIALMSNAWVGRTPVPTHYFLVIMRCEEGERIELCNLENVKTAAYIFPHTKGILTCDQNIQDYMRTYQATVLDVERITGTYFFPSEAVDASEEDLRVTTCSENVPRTTLI